MTNFRKYIFLAKLEMDGGWSFMGEMDADSPEAAVMGIARKELPNHNDAVTIDDVLNNYQRFSRWMIVPVESDDEGNPKKYGRGDLDLGLD